MEMESDTAINKKPDPFVLPEPGEATADDASAKPEASASMGAASLSPLRVGASVFVRCVTHYYTGRIVALTSTEIVLTDAAWIADTGRFGEALKTGQLNEIEPYADAVSIGRGSVVDVTLWRHALPRSAK